jgi:hypothetical protein
MIAKSFVQKINWPQAVAEVALIVAGIIVALAVDSWWQDKTERKVEIVYLEALKADFQENLESLEAAIHDHENVINVGDEVLNIIKAGLNENSTEDFFSKIGNELYFFHNWMPATGTYDDLVNSGRLLYIQSTQLRTALSEFQKSLEVIRQMEQLQTENYYVRQSPFLAEYQDANYQTWSAEYKPPVSPFSVNVDSFASLKYWNLVVEWIYIHSDIITNYRRGLADCNRILESIEVELAKSRTS